MLAINASETLLSLGIVWIRNTLQTNGPEWILFPFSLVCLFKLARAKFTYYCASVFFTVLIFLADAFLFDQSVHIKKNHFI